MTAITVTGWLLDTHALLWMLHGDKRLSKGSPSHRRQTAHLSLVGELLGNRDQTLRQGIRFRNPDDWNQIYPNELKRIGVPLLAPTIDDCRLLQELPKHHGDPFDRMLVCQAKRLGLGIISVDKIIDAYEVRREW